MSQAIALQPRSASRQLSNASAQAASLMLGHARAAHSLPPMQDDFGAQAPTLISVADLVGYIRRHWKLGVLVALPLAVATFAYLGMGKKIYEAESRLQIVIQDTNVFNFTELSHSAVSEVSAPMLVNNHRAELKARRFLDYLYDHLEDADRQAVLEEYAWKPTLLDRVGMMVGLVSAPPSSMQPRDLFAIKIADATRVEPLKDSHILRVQVRDEDAPRAARLANHFVSDYIQYTAQEDVSLNQAASGFLEKKGEELRKRLAESEKKLSDYKQSQSLVMDSDSRDIAGEKVRILTQSLADAEVKHAKAKHDMDSIRMAQKAGTDLLSVKLIGDSLDISATRKLLEAAQAELSDMRVLRGAKHPRVQEMNQKIATLQSQMDKNIEGTVAMVAQEESNSQLQVEDIRKQLQDSRHEVLADGGKSIQQDLLKDQVTMDRDLYQRIVLRMNQADMTGQFKDSGSLRVADIAVAPDKPVRPNKPIAALATLMVFGCFMFGVPVGTGFCKQYLMPALRGDPSVLPPAPGRAADALPDKHVIARLPEARPDASTNLLGELLRPGSRSSNVLRDLTVQLEGRARDRQGPGVILITSAEAGEGKTSLSAALAATFCSQGRRVFMIEGNANSPSFHLLFPRSYSHTAWKDDLEPLRYGGSNLFVLPSQNLPSNELTDLLENYRGWIEKAREEVDWIILDGSPMLRDLADITPLLPLATDVLVVHDPARGSAQQVLASLDLLGPRLADHTLCGVVLNRQDA